jgi:hypothetical protein
VRICQANWLVKEGIRLPCWRSISSFHLSLQIGLRRRVRMNTNNLLVAACQEKLGKKVLIFVLAKSHCRIWLRGRARSACGLFPTCR